MTVKEYKPLYCWHSICSQFQTGNQKPNGEYVKFTYMGNECETPHYGERRSKYKRVVEM
jgi:hypothetical protein